MFHAGFAGFAAVAGARLSIRHRNVLFVITTRACSRASAHPDGEGALNTLNPCSSRYDLLPESPCRDGNRKKMNGRDRASRARRRAANPANSARNPADEDQFTAFAVT